MKHLPYIFIILVSAIALRALFTTEYLPLMHDQVQAERVYEMAKSLSFGQFPVRWVADLGYGYGYPLFNYYAPLPYYLGAVIFLLGINLILATKVTIALAFIAAGLSMYLWAGKYWRRSGGVVSAVLYLLAPYHGVQLYVRGSVGELFTYALLPLVLYGLSELWEAQPNRKKALLGVAALWGIAVGHTVGLFMTTTLLGMYLFLGALWIFLKNRAFLPAWVRHHVLFFTLSLTLSAFFWVPALFELSYTNFSLASGNDVNYRDHFVTLGQLWQSGWGFGGSTRGSEADGLSFMIGKVTIMLALGALISLFATKQSRKPPAYLLGAAAALAGVSIFLMTESSRFIWELIPNQSIVQFPWRYLIFANLALTFMAGYSVSLLRGVTRGTTFRALIGITILALTVYILFSLTQFPKTKYFEANGYYRFNSTALQSQNHLRFAASKISDEYMPNGVSRPQSQEEVSTDAVSCLSLCLVKDVSFEPDKYSFTILNEKVAPVYLDKRYFPNFTVTVDGKEAKVLTGVDNMLGVTVPGGRHSVEFSLRNTPLRQAANVVSLLAFCALILYPFRRKLWNLKQKLKSSKI